ncbi:MAG TPA: GtrA family protein [Opitutaceae bacterium]
MVWKLARFGVVGVTVMIFFTGLNWLFGHWLGKDASFLLAYPPAVALHYWLNKTWTFGGARTHSVRQVSEYLLMVAVTFAVQAAVFMGLTTTTSLPGWAAAGLSNLAQMFLTFLAMQFRVFRPAKPPE